MRAFPDYFTVGGASLAVAAGTVGAVVWGGAAFVALAAVGVLALVALSAMVTRDGWKQATEALSIAQGVRAELDAVKKDAEEARKQAVSARNEANARPARAAAHPY